MPAKQRNRRVAMKPLACVYMRLRAGYETKEIWNIRRVFPAIWASRIATTPISSVDNRIYLREGQEKICVKSSFAKCAEQMLETEVGSHFARLSWTKPTHSLRLLFASGLSSPAKGIKWSEMPCLASATLEHPPTTHLFGIFKISWLLFSISLSICYYTQ